MNLRHILLLLISFTTACLTAQTIDISVLAPINRRTIPAFQNADSALEYQIGPLIPGHQYRIELSTEASSLVPTVRLLNGGSTSKITNYYWEGVALDINARFSLRPYNGPGHLVVLDLTEVYTDHSANSPSLSIVPIETEINDDAELLVNSIFRNQSCFETSNHEYTGFYGLFGSIQDTISQLGTFTNGTSALGIEQGIMMTTGRVSRASGPNNFSGTTQIYNTTSNDPDLVQLTGGNSNLFDVAIVEFDFTPTTDQINFNYVFASEEYCEEITNNTVDVFAFLISGPGISGPFADGAENIAVLPDGSSIDVTSINHLTNTGLYRSNIPDAFNQPCQIGPPVAPNDFEYDGMSTVLTATSEVIPCETYHLKLIIVDVGDQVYDSAVFLEAGSFAAGLVNVSEPGVTAEDAGLGNAPLEGCSDGTLVFSRLDSLDIANPLTIYYNISPTSSATFGVDYTMPVDSFIIEAGEFSDTLLIDIFGDDIAEGTESIILRLEGTCNCEANSTEFFIVDPPSMTLSLADPTADCPGSFTDLTPIVNGGVGFYDFQWSTGETDSVLNVEYFTGDSTYILSVTDNCGQLLTDTVIVSAPDIQASITGTYSLCDDPTAVIPIVLSGGSTNYSVDVLQDGTTISYTNTPGIDTIFLSITEAMDISLVSVSGDNCPGVVNGLATVTSSEFLVTAVLQDVLCTGDPGGSILIDVNGTPAAYTYNWVTAGLNGNNPTGLLAGTYPVSIEDVAGCTFDTMFTLNEPASSLNLVLDSLRDQSCTEMAYLAVSGQGGVGPYTYEWQDDNSVNPIRDNLAGNTGYEVVVTDQNGCTDTMTYQPIDLRPVVTAELSGNYSLCDAPTATIPVVLNGASAYTITVTENGISQTYTGGPDTIFLTYTSGTEVVLTSVAANGCTGTVLGSAMVFEENFNLQSNVTSLSCFGDNTGTIDFTLNGDVNDYTIVWDDATLSGNSLTGLIAGNYPVTITDSNNCVLDTTFMITQPSTAISLGLQSSSDQGCLNLGSGTVSAVGGTGTYTIDWGDGGATTFTRDDLIGDQLYSVTVTDENDCSEIIIVQVDDNRRTMDATINSSTTTLTCAEPGIDLTAAFNTAPAIYSWTDENGTIVSSTELLNVTQPGTYTLVVTDPSTSCSATEMIVIDQSGDFLELSDDGPYILTCAAPGADLSVAPVDFTGPVNYTWRNDNGILVSTSANLPGIVSPGTYTITAERVDNGCVTVSTIVVTEDKDSPDVDLQVATISCIEDTATLLIQNPDGQLNFEWSSGMVDLIGSTSSPFIQTAQTGTVRLTVTDTDNGCSLDTTILVTEDLRTLTARAAADQLLPCGDIELGISGSAVPVLPNTSFRWLDPFGNVLSETTDLSVQDRGVYTFEVTHPESGCLSTDEVTISQEGPDSVALSIQQPPCVEIGGSLVINSVSGGDAPYTYFIDGELAEFNANNRIGSLNEGSHLLTVVDINGCSLETPVQIFTPAEFTGTTENIDIKLGEDALLSFTSPRSNNLSSINWTAPTDLSCLNCPDPTAEVPLESFTATVALVDEDGCSLMLQQQVFVNRQQLVYAPNAISPYRPDGLNDKFTLYGDARFVDNIDYLRVFNRWGAVVWEGNNLEINNESLGWDGYFNGEELNGGAFVFSAQVTYFDGATEIIKGTINILR